MTIIKKNLIIYTITYKILDDNLIFFQNFWLLELVPQKDKKSIISSNYTLMRAYAFGPHNLTHPISPFSSQGCV